MSEARPFTLGAKVRVLGDTDGTLSSHRIGQTGTIVTVDDTAKLLSLEVRFDADGKQLFFAPSEVTRVPPPDTAEEASVLGAEILDRLRRLADVLDELADPEQDIVDLDVIVEISDAVFNVQVAGSLVQTLRQRRRLLAPAPG